MANPTTLEELWNHFQTHNINGLITTNNKHYTIARDPNNRIKLYELFSEEHYIVANIRLCEGNILVLDVIASWFKNNTLSLTFNRCVYHTEQWLGDAFSKTVQPEVELNRRIVI